MKWKIGAEEDLKAKVLFQIVGKCIGIVYSYSKLYIIVSLLVSIVLGVMPTLSLLVMQNIINCIQLNEFSEEYILFLVAIYIFLELTNVLTTVSFKYFSHKHISLFNRNIKLDMLKRITRLGVSDFEDAETYNIITRAQTGNTLIIGFYTDLLSIARSIISVLSSLLIAAKLNPMLLIITIIIPILKYIFIARMGKKQFFIQKRRTTKERTIWYYNHIISNGIAIKEMKAYELSEHWLGKIFNLSNEIINDDMKILRKTTIGLILLNTMEVLASGYVFSSIIYGGMKGTLLIGEVITYTRIVFNMKNSLESILAITEQIYKNALNVSNYFELIELKREEKEDGPVHLKEIKSIKVSNLSFRYTPDSPYVLKNISFELKKGDTVAFVGKNGSGKSTILKLLLGFYPNYEGAIEINGINLKKISYSSYLRLIANVFQDFMRYEDTLRENIQSGDIFSKKGDSDIIMALNSAGFDNKRLSLLPLDKMLGSWFDNSLQLSGGEWQRIAIGRAFFRTADMYVFDEPDAALDSDVENEILKKYVELMMNKIGIISSHRVNNIGAFVKRIIVLDKGEIVEDGSHDVLLKKNGVYSELFNKAHILN